MLKCLEPSRNVGRHRKHWPVQRVECSQNCLGSVGSLPGMFPRIVLVFCRLCLGKRSRNFVCCLRIEISRDLVCCYRQIFSQICRVSREVSFRLRRACVREISSEILARLSANFVETFWSIRLQTSYEICELAVGEISWNLFPVRQELIPRNLVAVSCSENLSWCFRLNTRNVVRLCVVEMYRNFVRYVV
jgi:hypothetical protein